MTMRPKATILIVDDEQGIRQSFNMVLKNQYNILMASGGKEALDLFSKNSVDLVFLDIILLNESGLDLLEKFKELDPNIEVVMVSAVKDVKTAVRAIKLGAYDYLEKPFFVEDILKTVTRALEKHKLVKEVAYLRGELERNHPFDKIIGKDKKMEDIFSLISSIADSDGSVLIQGESGTGKELIARAIYKLGPRLDQPFVVINCAAIPKTLMESEIFGHTKGAFTGAAMAKTGKLEIGDKGVIFLDDVDTLDIGMQAKLLRVIQEKEFEKVGSTKLVKIDSRFIASSNKNLKSLIEKGEFREDLYYRLNVFPIHLPPLRERRGDILLLFDYFLDIYAKRTGLPQKKLSKTSVDYLVDSYDWPGNVRELQNLVERLCTITKGDTIHLKSINGFGEDRIEQEDLNDIALRDASESFKKQLIKEVLQRVGGNKTAAAKMLGIHRNTIHKRIAG
jgi:two-component system, NtrC family, response regulator AtoC